MKTLSFSNIKQSDELTPLLARIKSRLEERVNLPAYQGEVKPVLITTNLVQRIAFAAGLTLAASRSVQDADAVQLSEAAYFHDTVFTRNNLAPLWSALLKLRYSASGAQIDWENPVVKSKIINFEMQRGAEHLLSKDVLNEWLLKAATGTMLQSASRLPVLNVNIGTFGGEKDAFAQPAHLNVNGRDIPNTQILIAGATGSGKTNLLAVLIQQMRSASVETPYPVNFLLFDYKGEFSDPANAAWLRHFEVESRCILHPVSEPMPFNPFKDLRGKPPSEVNLYATELSQALLALDNTSISANMANRLAEAVIAAYQRSEGAPVSFERVLEEYTALQQKREQDKTDSVKSALQQLIRANLFAKNDTADIIRSSFIIKLDSFPKDGILAKAVVYFTIAKLNALYETLPVQAVNEQCVEIRHFTIIDEAHYMLNFDNKPLRNLIAVGRNKGLSIILATQNMENFRSEYFDFYANAQYPLLMRQQTMNDRVLRDLFGVSGTEFQRLKEAIGGLKKGEVIIRNPSSNLAGAKKFRKITVTHLV